MRRRLLPRPRAHHTEAGSHARPRKFGAASRRHRRDRIRCRRSRPTPRAKARPKAEASGDAAAFADKSVRATHPSGATSANVVIMGSAAPAVAELSPEPDPQPAAPTEVKSELRTEARVEANAESLRDAVLNALGNQQMLVSILENAEWTAGRKFADRKSSGVEHDDRNVIHRRRAPHRQRRRQRSGRRPIKMLVEPGGTPQAASAPRRASTSNGSARSRAEQDPIVQRMKEKFGAEIRTVIDYREKR